MTAPVLLVFYSPSRLAESVQLARDVATVADELEGRLLAGLVDIDVAPAIAQAVQLQSIPFVYAVIDGRPAPLLQDVVPLEELRTALAQVLQQLTTQGITGRHQPRHAAPAEGEEEGEEQVDPRYAPAQDALAAGDYAGAVAAYQQLARRQPRRRRGGRGPGDGHPAAAHRRRGPRERARRRRAAPGRRRRPDPRGRPRPARRRASTRRSTAWSTWSVARRERPRQGPRAPGRDVRRRRQRRPARAARAARTSPPRCSERPLGRPGPGAASASRTARTAGEPGHAPPVHRDDLAGRHRVARPARRRVLAERRAAEPRHQRDAEPGGHQREVGVELHRLVRDARHAARCRRASGCSHWRQIVPSGVAIQPSSTRSRGVTPDAARQRVVAGHDDVGEVVADRRARPGARGWRAARRPSVWTSRGRSGRRRRGRRCPTARARCRREVEVGVGVAQRRGTDGGDQAARGRGERRHAQVAGDGAGPWCSAASISSRSASTRPPGRRAAGRARGEHRRPRPTRSSSGTPACRSSRLTCCETALGV